MALIQPQPIAVTGTSTVFTAPSASDTIIPSDRGVYSVRTTGTATTVVFVIPGNDVLGQPRGDISSTLGATDFKEFAVGALAQFADPTTQVITITHSGALTGVTAAYTTC